MCVKGRQHLICTIKYGKLQFTFLVYDNVRVLSQIIVQYLSQMGDFQNCHKNVQIYDF